jgi:hypothetical protein
MASCVMANPKHPTKLNVLMSGAHKGSVGQRLSLGVFVRNAVMAPYPLCAKQDGNVVRRPV